MALDAEQRRNDERVIKLKKVKSKASLRVSTTQSNFASLLKSPTKLEDVPVTVGRYMIKTFSQVLEQNEMFGSETFFSKNYKRKQNAAVISDHVVVLELRAESFDVLVKDQLRRERNDKVQFIFAHIPAMP